MSEIVTTRVEGLTGILEKPLNDKGKLKFSIVADVNDLADEELVTLIRLGGLRVIVDISSIQPALPATTPAVAPGQMSLDEINGTQPDGQVPARYSLLLTEVPTEDPALGKVEKALKKLTGMKVAEVRDNLSSLPWSLVIDGRDHFPEVEAVEHKLHLEGLGAFVSLVPWVNDEADAGIPWSEIVGAASDGQEGPSDSPDVQGQQATPGNATTDPTQGNASVLGGQGEAA